MNKQVTPRMSGKRELRVHTPAQKFEIRKNADGSRSIAGYAATFGDLSHDLGGFREKIAPGAFTISLADTTVDPLCLYSHDMANILGRRSSGTLTLAEDQRGLKFECKLPDTSVARDLIALMERGDLSKMSFGFSTDSDSWDDVGGQLVRTLLAVTLWEVSIVAAPAYESSSVNIRSCPIALRSKLTVRDVDDCAEDEQDEDGNCPGDLDYDDEETCSCRCVRCQFNDCARCEDRDCTDEVCIGAGCAMQDDTRSDHLRVRHLFAALRRSKVVTH